MMYPALIAVAANADDAIAAQEGNGVDNVEQLEDDGDVLKKIGDAYQ